MADDSTTKSSTTAKAKKAETTPMEEALEKGVLGDSHDDLPNEAYTVSGQGADTAKAEREAHERIRAEQRAASTEGG